MTDSSGEHPRRRETDGAREEPGTALFLDFDGTLVDIAATPDTVAVPGDLVPLLGRLTEVLDGAVAIITGRSIADIDRFLAPLDLVVAGVHGADLRIRTGETVHRTPRPIAPDVAAAVYRLAEVEPGLLVEPKGASIAVHYRATPAVGPWIEAELRHIVADAADDLVLLRGRRVLEIVPSHVSKGVALTALMDLPAFRGRQPIMIGDDISDEPAFEVAERLGGMALRVAGEHFTTELADFDGPDQVRAWLAALIERFRE